MLKLWLCGGLAIAWGATAHAGAVVDLVVQGSGPFTVGETVDVSVVLTQEIEGTDRFLRGVVLDFARTDPAITLNSFAFEFSTVPASDGFYATFPALPRPGAAFTGLSANNERQWILRADGSPLPVGTLNLTLPMVPGEYVLDPLNAIDPNNPNQGALVSFGFGVLPGDPITEWTRANGNLSLGEASGGGKGGVGAFQINVVPEPATWLFVAVGLAAILRRRF